MRKNKRSTVVLGSSGHVVAVVGLLVSLTGCGEEAKSATGDAGSMVQAGSGAADAPTWHQDIAPIVTEKCSGCHTEGGIAPFSMTSYDSVKPFASLMVSAVEDGRMPPFLARETDDCTPRLPWANDIRLTADETDLLRAWAKAGAPEGDAKHATKLAAPASIELERSDVVLTVPKTITVEGKQDMHTCMVLDPKLTKDEYVIGRQITAGNTAVLHHVVSYLLVPRKKDDGTMQTKAEMIAALKAEKNIGPGGMYDCFGGPGLETVTTQMLDAWAPGGIPNMAPPDSGQPMSKDSLVLLDVHYHPTGAGVETDDSTHLGLMLATEKPKMISRVILLGNFQSKGDSDAGAYELLKQPNESKAEFMIPPGEAKHVEEMTWTWKLPTELKVYGMGTHMHYVGQDMRVSLKHMAPTGDEPDDECLIETPVWNFNWQRGYGYDADYADLPGMRNGDTLEIRCVYNNTMDNPYLRRALADQNLDAPVAVALGENTLDEMCLAAIGIMYPNAM